VLENIGRDVIEEAAALVIGDDKRYLCRTGILFLNQYDANSDLRNFDFDGGTERSIRFAGIWLVASRGAVYH
jgi:hypothetical protein